MEIGRDRTFGQDPASSSGDEPAGEPEATSGLLGHDRQLPAVPIVHLDADSGDHPTVVVERHETGPVERGEPLREVVGLVLEPLAEIGDVRIDPVGRAEHARTEGGGPDAEDGAEFVAEPGPVHVVAECSTDSLGGVRRHSDHRSDAITHTLQRADGPIPRRLRTRRIADHVDAFRRWRPRADPRAQVEGESVAASARPSVEARSLRCAPAGRGATSAPFS